MELFVAGEGLPTPEDRVGLKLELEQDGKKIDLWMVDERGAKISAGFLGSFYPNAQGRLRFQRAQSANAKYTTYGAVEVV